MLARVSKALIYYQIGTVKRTLVVHTNRTERKLPVEVDVRVDSLSEDFSFDVCMINCSNR